ncbi:hypothetical protein MKZ38_008885 [Zalerion maritima]|uniref:Transcription elongation factor S-II n=1 Tax=Zalerion maritima TaxID=339359 RepID=A0AAD5S249_9PEZI|nr:hypothetical protein MKZ38_008885 [Zalerion maritima]
MSTKMMNVRDLDSNTKAVTKAINAKEPSENVLTLITRLKEGGNPTEEMLRSTKAGVIIGKLRANENKEIAKAASELVGRWRKAVEVEKRKRAGPSATPAAAPAASDPKIAAKTSPAPPTARAKGEPYKGDSENRKNKTDGVNINRTGSSTRNACIGLMYDGLAYRSSESIMDVLEKAVACEAAAYDKYGGETQDYKKKLRSLFQNLKAKTNKELGQNVMSGKLSPKTLVSMSPDDLKSSELKKTEEKLMQENIKNAQVAQETRSISAELICGGCNQRKVAYTQAQTRSADEPMTTFCECMNCGKRWKFS